MRIINEKLLYPEPNTGCLLWAGSLSYNGYGLVSVNGEVKRAHRVSWENKNGPIPKGLSVLHKCDTPACVNTNHLFLGTQKDNMKDMLKKGRGGARGRTKFTHCLKGHSFDLKNTYVCPRTGNRLCRTCHRERVRRNRAKKN